MFEGPFILKYVEGCGRNEWTKYFENYVFYQVIYKSYNSKMELIWGVLLKIYKCNDKIKLSKLLAIFMP